jgi:TatD DNase family protein
MFVDSHCHLEGPRFREDRAQVLARARAAGVEAVLAIGNGNGPDEVDCALKLAEQFDPEKKPRIATDEHGSEDEIDKEIRVNPCESVVTDDSPDSAGDRRLTTDDFPRIFATIGVHPHEARLAEERHWTAMEALARHPRIIAWGEIGLDYHYDHSPRDVQRRVLLRQCELAAAARLPIVIHCRPSDGSTNAWDDLFALLRDAWAGNGLGGVLHCFTGTPAHARAALDLGFMISFAGNVTYPKAVNIQQTARDVPLGRMFIETDSPYLAPIPHRGKRNEPAYVAETAKFIATLRGLRPEEVGEATTRNFYRFFDV